MVRTRSALWLALLAALGPACGNGGSGGANPGLPSTDAQIQAVRNAPNSSPVSLPIDHALVTFLKPNVGEPAGFFVQDSVTGPAIFVQIDPTTLTPAPAVGDRVSFIATLVLQFGPGSRITALTNFTRSSTGEVPHALDVSNATDLVSAIDSYESRLIHVQGSIDTAFFSSGLFEMASMSTAGMVSNPQLVLRSPIPLIDALDLVPGTTFMVTTPFCRFTGTAQVSIWTAPDITILTAPAPRVLSAAAASSTSVAVTFDRRIDPATVLPSGSQFALDNGLTASAATVSARTVTLTTTTQTTSTAYHVTVAGTVRDNIGDGVDPSFASAAFTGF